MAAQAGTLTLVSKNRTWGIDLYVPDATGTNITFNAAGIAVVGSPATYRIPEDCVIYDISGAAPTAVGAALSVNSGVVNGGTFRWTNQLATLPNRQKLNVPLKAGDFIQYLQF